MIRVISETINILPPSCFLSAGPAQARDGKGDEVAYDDKSAMRFTLDGALRRAALNVGASDQEYFDAVHSLLGMWRHGTVAEFSDRSGHGKIISYLRRLECEHGSDLAA